VPVQAPKNGHTILVGEDELEVRGYLEMALESLGYGVELAQDAEEVINALRSTKSCISAVLLDLMMSQSEGMETLRAVRHIAPDLPVIIVSASSSTTDIVAAMKCGASDFLCSPVAHEDLKAAIARAIEDQMTWEHISHGRSAKTSGFIGRSPQIKQILSQVPMVGWSEAPVLIQGETGSGKEVLARELHANSPRAEGPFLKLNCAALPSELVESELFGYERGAFTGAFQKKAGMFEMAARGTILLDEIGDMDVRLQAKLLHVLQDHEFQRIGGKEMVKVNVRVIAATHQDLERAISERTFREDLYYRLNVISLQLPPLRERADDIMPLAQHLIAKHSSGAPGLNITMDLANALQAYPWPGNVRELENVMRRLVVLRNPALICSELQARTARKPPSTAGIGGFPAAPSETGLVSDSATPILEQVTKAKQQAEAEAILAALNSTRWNRKQAAALLKIDYKALLYKMKKLGVEDDVLPIASSTNEAIPRVAAAAG
jgi:two-component system, NtrC family, response regulator AtoC